MKSTKLKDLLLAESRLTTEEKESFLQEVSTFGAYAEAVYRNSKLKEVANKINNMMERAEQFTLAETEDWFDQVTVKRNLKELKNNAKTFSKTVEEINVLQQRLESLYEEMGHTLGRYYDV